jgi:hypothetical protein
MAEAGAELVPAAEAAEPQLGWREEGPSKARIAAHSRGGEVSRFDTRARSASSVPL